MPRWRVRIWPGPGWQGLAKCGSGRARGRRRQMGGARRRSRPGTMIIADNVVRGGGVTDADSDNAAVRGVREFLRLLAAEPRVSTTAIQTVGGKGHDGFSLSVVLTDPAS